MNIIAFWTSSRQPFSYCIVLCLHHDTYYSAPVGVRSIVINPSVCLSVCVLSVCLSVCEHISGTAGPIFTKF